MQKMALRGSQRLSLYFLSACGRTNFRRRILRDLSYSQGYQLTNPFRSRKGTEVRWRRPLIITSLTLPFFKKVNRSGSPAPNPALPRETSIEISRIMLPDDTNPSGNVHGGTILKLIEQAGHVVANRHCNGKRKEGDPPITTVLVRLERMDFLQPMLVGEVAQLQAAVTYTSPHSMEVTVDVWAENVITCERRHTNTAFLWYVGLESKMKPTVKWTGRLRELVTSIPPLTELSDAQLEAGRKRYEAQKQTRTEFNKYTPSLPILNNTPSLNNTTEIQESHTVMGSQTTLANVVLPSDCAVTGHMMGGALMKMMDSAAGICATRHCSARTVTACIDVIDFHEPVINGEVVFVTARMVFTSAKSMEIEVMTEAAGLEPESRRITNTAHFTFVSLGDGYRPVPVPQLKLQSKEEEKRFEEGKKRYLTRKAVRLEAMK